MEKIHYVFSRSDGFIGPGTYRTVSDASLGARDYEKTRGILKGTYDMIFKVTRIIEPVTVLPRTLMELIDEYAHAAYGLGANNEHHGETSDDPNLDSSIHAEIAQRIAELEAR